MKKFLSLIKDCQDDVDFSNTMPLVFVKKNKVYEQEDLVDPENPLAAPWPKFSMEAEDPNELLLLLKTDDNKYPPFHIHAIHCQELSPDNYQYYMLTGMADSSEIVTLTVHRKKVPELYDRIYNLMHNFLEKFYSWNTGIITNRKSIAYKHRRRKRRYCPRNFVYVRTYNPDKTLPDTNESGKRVRWLKGWSVRSHWRKIRSESMGKNRWGERNISGRTWIEGYRKGDKVQEEIMKPRKKVVNKRSR